MVVVPDICNWNVCLAFLPETCTSHLFLPGIITLYVYFRFELLPDLCNVVYHIYFEHLYPSHVPDICIKHLYLTLILDGCIRFLHLMFNPGINTWHFWSPSIKRLNSEHLNAQQFPIMTGIYSKQGQGNQCQTPGVKFESESKSLKIIENQEINQTPKNNKGELIKIRKEQ